VLPGAHEELARAGVGGGGGGAGQQPGRIIDALSARADVSPAEYDAFLAAALPPDTPDVKLETGDLDPRLVQRLSSEPHAVLTAISGYRREYEWLGVS
jgi:hypothetical protein